MARPRTSKASKIRTLLEANPGASAKEIVAKLAAKGVKVTPAHVYNLKGKIGKPKARATHSANGIDALIQAKKLADAMGGVEKARAALDVLAKLV